MLYAFLISPVRASCLDRLNLLDLITAAGFVKMLLTRANTQTEAIAKAVEFMHVVQSHDVHSCVHISAERRRMQPDVVVVLVVVAVK
jgi:N-acetylglutamate synthase-like GNAT family acetyltransferase